MKSWLWWLHRTSTSCKVMFMEASLEVIVMAGGVGCRSKWDLSDKPQEMFNVVFPLMHLFQGCWYFWAFWAGRYQTAFVLRWVIHPLVSFPVRAFLRQDQHLFWMVPAESCVASSQDGCWFVQDCQSFAFTCLSPHVLAQGAKSREPQQPPNGDRAHIALYPSSFSPSLSPVFYSPPSSSVVGGCSGHNEALPWHLPPPLFYPSFSFLSGCCVALSNFGSCPRNNLSTHTNQEG